MKNKFYLLLIFIIATTILSGCMYPEEKMAQNQTPYKDQVDAVQNAIKQYQEDNGGLLPIKTRDMETPIYQKYPIEFKKIVPKYLADHPGNSFESGGIFQYVLVDVENNPTVKLFDLRISETIREIKIRLKMQEYPPFKERIAGNVYTLDFKKLGYKEDPYVVSPFTNQNLPFVISGDAEIYVDYRSDLYQVMQKEKHNYQPGEDMRDILVTNSMFVPAYSLPYTIDEKTEEPIFLTK
ncbi:hypothetical protein SM124_05500 (plasmid) [Bacillus sp. 31A1R]|uniref:ABC transporter periplasmic binding protein yphF n=1 Tax=Robertmurraya mangrovi TaxID=3098077 RepID=A0ABU5IVM9_9BACI|nr:hypothetical protein [Bacillus sp. 31A1R]MDZ5471195.1 hypothetical protein [Bacillus sp. 31A1R]